MQISPNLCAWIVYLHNEERVRSVVNKTFQKWKINITKIWPANIYLVMWLTDWLTDQWTDRLTDGPTNWPTDWTTNKPTNQLTTIEREENPYPFWLSKYELFFSHTPSLRKQIVPVLFFYGVTLLVEWLLVNTFSHCIFLFQLQYVFMASSLLAWLLWSQNLEWYYRYVQLLLSHGLKYVAINYRNISVTKCASK